MSWSVAHRIAGVRFYYKTKSIIQTQRHLGQQFNIPQHGTIPSHNAILAWVHKFEDTGGVTDIAHGAPRTGRTEENVRRVRESFQQSSRRSPRQQSRILGISRRSLGRILQDIKFHPYKIQIAQKFYPRDKVFPVECCNTMLRMINGDPDVLNLVLMSDEVHFHVTGFVNKQNMCYWAPVNPIELHDQPLHSP